MTLTHDSESHPEFCERCSGPWGEDETCANCTLADGSVRPTVYHTAECAGEPPCRGCGWYDQFGNWIPGPEGG